MSDYPPDEKQSLNFTRRPRIDKAAQSLLGLIRGVAMDGVLNAAEIAEVMNWLREYEDLFHRSPFNEFKEKLDGFLADGVLDAEEQEDLVWACLNLTPEGGFYDGITHDIQQLHGIMHGILADGIIRLEEARELQAWADDHEHLKGTYPYDELESLLTSVLKDGHLDANEQETLKAFFEDFVQYSQAARVKADMAKAMKGIARQYTLSGVCAASPEIKFKDRIFTLTGSSTRKSRREILKVITDLGGGHSPQVCSKTQYLVVGDGGNPCWAFSCYGRKVQAAVEMRKAGAPITIVHESDFWDAIQDATPAPSSYG
jgi:hypothetical protein